MLSIVIMLGPFSTELRSFEGVSTLRAKLYRYGYRCRDTLLIPPPPPPVVSIATNRDLMGIVQLTRLEVLVLDRLPCKDELLVAMARSCHALRCID